MVNESREVDTPIAVENRLINNNYSWSKREIEFYNFFKKKKNHNFYVV